MSDSYTVKLNGRNHWNKLAAYLDFRMAVEGLWFKDAEFWHRAITSDWIHIDVAMSGDSGGGPLHHYNIKVYQPGEELFELNFSFDEVWSLNAVFAKRAKETYRYMKSYSEGNTWYERACYGDDEDIVDYRIWNALFGPLDDVDRVTCTELDNVRSSLPRAGFHVLGGLGYIVPKGDVTFGGKTAEQIESAKRWALFTLLEMQRSFFASC